MILRTFSITEILLADAKQLFSCLLGNMTNTKQRQSIYLFKGVTSGPSPAATQFNISLEKVILERDYWRRLINQFHHSVLLSSNNSFV